MSARRRGYDESWRPHRSWMKTAESVQLPSVVFIRSWTRDWPRYRVRASRAGSASRVSTRLYCESGFTSCNSSSYPLSQANARPNFQALSARGECLFSVKSHPNVLSCHGRSLAGHSRFPLAMHALFLITSRKLRHFAPYDEVLLQKSTSCWFHVFVYWLSVKVVCDSLARELASCLMKVNDLAWTAKFTPCCILFYRHPLPSLDFEKIRV